MGQFELSDRSAFELAFQRGLDPRFDYAMVTGAMLDQTYLALFSP